MATPRVAAGALFFDEHDPVLLVKPHYKTYWDFPADTWNPANHPALPVSAKSAKNSASPSTPAPCSSSTGHPLPTKATRSSLSSTHTLSNDDQQRTNSPDNELAEWRFVTSDDLDPYGPERLTRRIRSAVTARNQGQPSYAEHGMVPA